MAKLFGDNCKFLSIFAVNFDEIKMVMEELIRAMKTKQPSKFKKFLMGKGRLTANVKSSLCSIS